jgi:hypothetical protein
MVEASAFQVFFQFLFRSSNVIHKFSTPCNEKASGINGTTKQSLHNKIILFNNPRFGEQSIIKRSISSSNHNLVKYLLIALV